jgi:GTP-binding protein
MIRCFTTITRNLNPSILQNSRQPISLRQLSVKRKKRNSKANSNSPNSSQKVPPALLIATASPHVYVARTALDESIDPMTLFSEGREVPPLLAQGEFVYLSPKALKHKFPDHGIPEVAFLGRSNVGKSSLINSILRKNLCITSKHPGRTQQPYYYGLFPNGNTDRAPANVTGFVIDLPGYGFAAAPKEKAEAWQANTQDLLMDRRDSGVLKRLFLLIDARRDEPTEMDRTVIAWLEDANIPYSLVLTKVDRASRPQIVKLVNEFCMRYASHSALEGDDGFAFQSPVIHTTSSTRNLGVHELMISVEAEFCDTDEDES